MAQRNRSHTQRNHGNHTSPDRWSNSIEDSGHEAAEESENPMHQALDSAREGVMQAQSAAGRLVSKYPAPSVLMSFGFGLGVGLLVASTFPRRSTWGHHSWAQNLRMPDSVRHFAEELRHMPEHVYKHFA